MGQAYRMGEWRSLTGVDARTWLHARGVELDQVGEATHGALVVDGLDRPVAIILAESHELAFERARLLMCAPQLRYHLQRVVGCFSKDPFWWEHDGVFLNENEGLSSSAICDKLVDEATRELERAGTGRV